MGIPVMSRFQNPFAYGRFEKVGNFSIFNSCTEFFLCGDKSTNKC